MLIISGNKYAKQLIIINLVETFKMSLIKISGLKNVISYEFNTLKQKC